MSTDKSKTIIIAPLDWGLGHATRSIPLINYFNSLHYKVIICSYGNSGILLRKEFPQLEHITVEGIHASYTKGKAMALKMFFQLPKFLKAISNENLALQKLIDKIKPDFVISDNRYGFFTKKIPCYFITHQVFIKAGIFSILTNYLNRFYLKKYTEVWIPDAADEKNNLSGTLSHGKTNLKIKYIGPLSRFEYENHKEIKYKYTAIISGPEPQRSVFENTMTEFLLQTQYNCSLVGGLPDEENATVKNNVAFFSHLNSGKMKELIESSEIILCRSGYTSIMELVSLKKKVVFFATPGQTEQEYLENYFTGKPELQTGEIVLINGVEKRVIDLGKLKQFEFNNLKSTNLQITQS